jgi:(1->4)-alpha-D-glucan 1-alpha-D-glucosylmutase
VRGEPGPFYVVVEKILIGEERLPESWPVAGTTGYEFANEALGLMVSGAGLAELARIAGRFIGREQDYPALAAAAKVEVLDRLFAGELAGLSRRPAETSGLSPEAASEALRRLLVALPVYRTYADASGLGRHDRALLEQALVQAAEGAEAPCRAILAQAGATLLAPEGAALLRGLQQLSGPVMAKSIEDTTFYRYHRLLALNEVGGEADSTGCDPERFHRRAADRLRHWPDMLLATATHDTKRSEDARARLAVLSELPAEWEAAVAQWRQLSDGPGAIHPADEYAFYQALVGAWPEGLRPDDQAGLAALAERLAEWQRKALREGKERSSWDEPDAEYEGQALDFLQGAMKGRLPAAVAAFIARIDAAAIANSLGQLLLKLSSPGVPDIYQGTEQRDFSLVDPDNRRPVDFDAMASGAKDSPKARVLRRVLAFRLAEPELFARGEYHPLRAEGPLAGHVLTFARVRNGRAAIVAITRLLGQELLDTPTLPAERWRDTFIPLPPELRAARWSDVLGEATVEVADGRLNLPTLLGRFPVAMVASG